ncbi:MAG: hypothetical protein ACK47B_10985 [Armatimonadota bacterium]
MASKPRIRLESRIGRVTKETRRKLAAVVYKTASDIEAHAKVAIQTGPKTGRIYRAEQTVSFKSGDTDVSFTAYAGKKGHQASAPGEAPATDTGNLAASITTKKTGLLRAQVTVGAECGAALEFGTADGKIAPRPFLQPAVDAVEPAFEPAIRAALVQAAREAGDG